MEAVQAPPAPADRSLYPVREEDHVVQGPAHFRQCTYLTSALQSYRPEEWWILGDACLYWDPEHPERYVAPDVAVVQGPPPDPLPSVYLAWEDPPLLFVAEIVSKSSVARDRSEKPYIYENALKVPEYLYADPERRELRLWQLGERGYRKVPPGRDHQVWSPGLGLGFGYDRSGFLRIIIPSGEMLLTHAEERSRADAEARARAEAERRLADALAELERLRQQHPDG